MNKFILFSLFVLNFSVGFSQNITGAWTRNLDTAVQYLTVVDNYFAVATFNLEVKKFISTRGGTAMVEKGKMSGVIEFNTVDRTEVKSGYSYDIKLKGNTMMLPLEGNAKKWQKVDEATESLAGNWRITGREQSGTMTPIKPAARKTIKILSGTRFQWAAINMETGEFFGTGGGHYSLKDGTYTEHIEFFSRDATRVGASLSFKAKINTGEWHHSGLSSKGEKIHEVWSRK
jgi:hypothetical protein